MFGVFGGTYLYGVVGSGLGLSPWPLPTEREGGQGKGLDADCPFFPQGGGPSKQPSPYHPPGFRPTPFHGTLNQCFTLNLGLTG